jgi:hypothetical protein
VRRSPSMHQRMKSLVATAKERTQAAPVGSQDLVTLRCGGWPAVGDCLSVHVRLTTRPVSRSVRAAGAAGRGQSSLIAVIGARSSASHHAPQTCGHASSLGRPLIPPPAPRAVGFGSTPLNTSATRRPAFTNPASTAGARARWWETSA